MSRRYGTISGLFQHLDKTRLLDVAVSDLRDWSVGPVMARPRAAAEYRFVDVVPVHRVAEDVVELREVLRGSASERYVFS